MSVIVDVTTTSVGRGTVRTAYDSFFRHVRFSGTFRVVVVVDPAYGVSSAEQAETVEYLEDLPRREPRVREVVLDVLPRQVGLANVLSILLAHARADVGVHLEDDWEITRSFDLDALVRELHAQASTEIVLTSSHTARGGTFERAGDVVPVSGSAVDLLRLTRSSWAAFYLPLAPHVHRTAQWAPTVARALALTDPVRCPDERVRERIIAERTVDVHNVLWTRDVLARDIGREWLAERRRFKAITHEHAAELPAQVPCRPDSPLPLARSAVLLAEATDLMPGVTQTFLKRPENFAPGAFPVYAERGSGTVLWDVDGTGYVDFVLSLGAASLGHAHPLVTNVVRERVGRGVLLSLPAPAEIEAARELVRAVPGVDRVRFLKSGAEACSAALRLARHLTGRARVLLAGYHGWHDQLVGPSEGVPAVMTELGSRRTLNTPAEDEALLQEVRAAGHDLAALVLSTPYHRTLDAGFLRLLREACDDTGCLLVLDEIVTGFRLAPGGLGHLLGVRGDLLCFSKGLAAGMPLAAVAGSAELMADFGRLKVSTTFGGELLSLEVMKVALREYARGDYYQRIATLGARLRDGLNARAGAAGLGSVAVGYDAMPCLRFSDDADRHAQLAEHFVAGMARRGFLLRRDVNFVSAVHTEADVDRAVEAAAEVLPSLAARHATRGSSS